MTFRLAIITAALLAAPVARAQPGATPPATPKSAPDASPDGADEAERPPLETDPVARRHVRGCPVDRDCRAQLEAGLREFEVEAFPRGKATGSPWVDTGATERANPRRARRKPVRKPTEIRPDLPWLAQLRMPDFPVTWDERIIKYLEFYKDDQRGRNIMGAWLRDQGKWRDLMLRHLRRAGLPDDLIYVAMIESSYDPLEYSRAGAAGLWQFMRHGGRVYGLRIDRWVDERYDPVRSTEAVVHYWNDLYQRFGDWDLALAAYNAGYAAVLRSIAKYNTNDFWQLVDYENALPWGSSIYVPKALAAAIVGHNRKLFGYDELSEAPEVQWDNVAVPRSVSLKMIARAAGVSTDAVKELNPQLRRGRTPPGTKKYVVKVPRGSGKLFRERFRKLRAEWDVYDEYIVRAGERFEDIATMYGIHRARLRRLNGIEHESEVGRGMTLIVPRISEEEKQRNHQEAMDKLYAGGHPKGDPGDKLVVAVPDAEASVSGKRRVFYRVVTGDSQYKVAKAFGVDRADLARWNGLDPEGYLHARMVLQLWIDPDFDTAQAGVALLDPDRMIVVTRGSPDHIAAAEARLGRERLVYRPKRKESLAQIGKKFGLSDRDLARINRISRKTEVGPGDEVIVYKVVDRRKSDRAREQARKARRANKRRSKKRAPKKRATRRRGGSS